MKAHLMKNVTGQALFTCLDLFFSHLKSMSIQVCILDLLAHNKAIPVRLLCIVEM